MFYYSLLTSVFFFFVKLLCCLVCCLVNIACDGAHGAAGPVVMDVMLLTFFVSWVWWNGSHSCSQMECLLGGPLWHSHHWADLVLILPEMWPHSSLNLGRTNFGGHGLVFSHNPQSSVTPHASCWRERFGWTTARIINNRAKENPQVPVLMFAKCLMQIYTAFVSWCCPLLSSTDGTTKALSFTVIALSILSWSDNLWVVEIEGKPVRSCNEICHGIFSDILQINRLTWQFEFQKSL